MAFLKGKKILRPVLIERRGELPTLGKRQINVQIWFSA
ncbi:hypothetical protein V461_06775 [Pantoea ananatis BRT98]|nr:hypothetical protein V461_06775 [Pantoea ananatis BRT98]